jgi:type IV secretory pathway VirB2 component (pilin)
MKINTNKISIFSIFAFSIFAIIPVIFPEATSSQLFAQTVTDVTASISSNSLTRVMCNALRIVQGSAGKTFAAFAIIAVGIGFFSGKVSWGLMIGVAAGIAAMFGAPSIVAAISGQNTDMNCGSAI